MDGHVLLARAAHHQRCQANDHDVRALVGGAHVQRATRCRFPRQPQQQLLLGPVAHHAVPVRAARRLRHRVDRTVVALRSVLAVQEDLPHIHQLDQEGRAQPDGDQGAGLHRVARHSYTAAAAPCPHHLLPGVAHLVAPRSQQRFKSEYEHDSCGVANLGWTCPPYPLYGLNYFKLINMFNMYDLLCF